MMRLLSLPSGIGLHKLSSACYWNIFFYKSDIVVISSRFSSFFGLWQGPSALFSFRGGRMNEDSQRGPDSGRVGSQPCHIRRAVALMEANFAAKLSREEMARAAGLSGSYFNKLFTQCIGLSPHQLAGISGVPTA